MQRTDDPKRAHVPKRAHAHKIPHGERQAARALVAVMRGWRKSPKFCRGAAEIHVDVKRAEFGKILVPGMALIVYTPTCLTSSRGSRT
jgi:hypothetical protein